MSSNIDLITYICACVCACVYAPYIMRMCICMWHAGNCILQVQYANYLKYAYKYSCLLCKCVRSFQGRLIYMYVAITQMRVYKLALCKLYAVIWYEWHGQFFTDFLEFFATTFAIFMKFPLNNQTIWYNFIWKYTPKNDLRRKFGNGKSVKAS